MNEDRRDFLKQASVAGAAAVVAAGCASPGMTTAASAPAAPRAGRCRSG
jgi:anaerobic selenocysteine-containing dehydrogenase